MRNEGKQGVKKKNEEEEAHLAGLGFGLTRPRHLALGDVTGLG